MISSHIMQILHSFISFAILAPFLPTNTLVASLATPDPMTPKRDPGNSNYKINDLTPDCAAPPTVFDSLPYEFWIQVVFLDPVDDDVDYYRQGDPLRTERYVMPYSGVLYDGAFIARPSQPRDLYLLDNNFLVNTNDDFAKLWPDKYNANSFSGYNPVAFQTEGDFDEFAYELAFRAVKVCTSKNETELQLRAKRRDGVDKGVFVPGLPLPLCNCMSKNGKIMEAPSAENRSRGTVTQTEGCFADVS